MKKPQPKKHAECDQCLRDRPLLMPVAFIPGWPIVMWSMLCWQCRTSIQVSRHWDRYCIPGYIYENSHDPKLRATYLNWLELDDLALAINSDLEVKR
jgi:hypothetical protein